MKYNLLILVGILITVLIISLYFSSIKIIEGLATFPTFQITNVSMIGQLTIQKFSPDELNSKTMMDEFNKNLFSLIHSNQNANYINDHSNNNVDISGITIKLLSTDTYNVYSNYKLKYKIRDSTAIAENGSTEISSISDMYWLQSSITTNTYNKYYSNNNNGKNEKIYVYCNKKKPYGEYTELDLYYFADPKNDIATWVSTSGKGKSEIKNYTMLFTKFGTIKVKYLGET